MTMASGTLGRKAHVIMRIGRFAAWLIMAGSILMLGAPAIGVASTSVETPQTPQSHASEDAVVLSPSAEARLSRETREKTAAASTNAALATAGDPGEVGQWGPVVNWPVVAVWAALLPNGKVLAYDSIGDRGTQNYVLQDHTRATVWDPAAGSQTEAWLRDGYNIFCSGFAHLPNGSIFIAGGNKDKYQNGIVQTHYFDWENDTWSLGENMSYARWYPSVTAMGSDEMLITSGGAAIPEVRQSDGTLRQLSNASLSLPLYPWFDVAPDGRAFDSGPDQTMRSLDPSGAGTWQLWGKRDLINRTYGSHAVYDVGKILVAGGGISTNTAEVIDTNGATPTATPTGSMAYGRRQNNLTVLADGTVLVTGGNSSGATYVDLNAGVYAAELWSPATGQWTTLASMRETRQYHSTALLLPDGRVLSAGGGICGECDEVGYLNKNAEIFSPPYLFAKDGSGALAPRPTVAAAPSTVTESTNFTVSTPDAASITKVALVRLGAVTHSNNMDQRYVPVQFTAGSGKLTVTAPANVNIAPPGDYMLFLVNSAGVPSVAPIVSVARPGPSVSGIDPNSGPAHGGTSVTITGTDFNEVSAVQFGAIDAASFTVNSSTSITAISPPGTGTPSVTVTNPRGTSLASPVNRFSYAPVVSGVSPAGGPSRGGTSVAIIGTNLQEATAVNFGSAKATSFTVNSATSITAVSPGGAGTVDVTVISPGGTSLTSPGDLFSYLPAVTNVSPSLGPVGGETTVTITGVNFNEVSTVQFGPTNATSFTVNSTSSITAISPAGAGRVDVTVTTPGGTSATSAADQFSYLARPTVTKLKPTNGPVTGGTSVTITGTNFIGATAVKFGSTNASSFAVSTVKGVTSITAVSPPMAAGIADVTVTTPGGTSAISSADRFKFLPTVSGLSPNSGSQVGGTSVTVSGTGFALGKTATIFKFGGTKKATSVNCIATTECTVVSPAHAVGTVDVKATVNKVSSAKTAADQFTYN